MLNKLITSCFRFQAGAPAFRIYGKVRWETSWRVIDIFASRRHNVDSRWPLLRGACVTWTDEVIVVGWDFAEIVVQEQRRGCRRSIARPWPQNGCECPFFSVRKRDPSP
jgi:hypothetical protein